MVSLEDVEEARDLSTAGMSIGTLTDAFDRPRGA